MKKKLIFLVATVGIVAFSACTSDKDLYDPTKFVEQKEAEYAHAFAQKYGEIAKDQDWGFGKSQGTRASSPNSNQWHEYTVVPEGITAAEQEKVTEWFKNHQNPSSENVYWTDFFVQHVSGTHSNMDYLCSVIEGSSPSDDHIYNFNATQGSIMLMVNSGTSSFGYHNSLDNKMHYNYTIQCIDGSYYVGFDFEATGENPNQQSAADGYYNDWIVKISPAIYTNAKRIIAEDLGNTDDFDFNDVVFDVAWDNDGTIITLQAAGGTMPLYIQVGEEKKEVHELFGVSTATMVNTTSVKKAPVIFRLPKCNGFNDVEILVNDVKAGMYKLKAETGKAPQKICVPTKFQWTSEREAIDSKYPGFEEWVSNPEYDWLGE